MYCVNLCLWVDVYNFVSSSMNIDAIVALKKYEFKYCKYNVCKLCIYVIVLNLYKNTSRATIKKLHQCFVLFCFSYIIFLGKYIKPCGIIFWGFWENICYWNEILIMLLLIYGRLVQKNKSRSSFWGMFASHIRLLTHLRLCHEAALLIQFIHIIGPLHSRRP